jgi:hypothetical protein
MVISISNEPVVSLYGEISLGIEVLSHMAKDVVDCLNAT